MIVLKNGLGVKLGKIGNFRYFPSFSVGGFGDALRQDFKFNDGFPCRFYSDGFPEKYRHREFLISAGHFLKRPDLYGEHGFTSKNVVMGDSGGFQIASGALKWNPEITPKSFKWLEDNSDISMNLDIPPRLKYEGKFQECLDISLENFKYFADNQTGKTEFLNVIQGNNRTEYKKWYDEVKQFTFQGWAIGGASGNPYRFVSGLCALLNGKEHLNDNNKTLHVLGTSRIKDLFILIQLQKSLEEVGSKMMVTTDSSSPDRAVVFGTYYSGYSMKRASWEGIGFPNEPNHPDIVDDFLTLEHPSFPIINEFDVELVKHVDFTSVKDRMAYTTGMRLHNFHFFKDVIDKIESLVYSHDFILQQSISNDLYMVLHSIDEIVKNDDPDKIFEKYQHLYTKMSNTKNELKVKTHSFF